MAKRMEAMEKVMLTIGGRIITLATTNSPSAPSASAAAAADVANAGYVGEDVENVSGNGNWTGVDVTSDTTKANTVKNMNDNLMEVDDVEKKRGKGKKKAKKEKEKVLFSLGNALRP